MIVGEYRKKMRAVARDALVHGPPEGRLRPIADAGLRIGRDVGRIEDAEWRGKRVAAGEFLHTLRGMTFRAIAAACESLSLGDQFRCKAARSRRRHRSDGRPPRQHAESYKPETTEHHDADDQLLEHGVLRQHAQVHVMNDYATGIDGETKDFQRTANRCEVSRRTTSLTSLATTSYAVARITEPPCRTGCSRMTAPSVGACSC